MNDTSPRLDPQKVRIGVTPTLWWNDDFPLIDNGVTFLQCISEMALAGYQGCSVGHKYPTDTAVLKRELDLRGLQVSEPWISLFFTISEMEKRTIESFHTQLEFIREMGGTDMVCAELGRSAHPLPVSVFANRAVFDDRQWDALSNGLNKLGEIASSEGMRLCYHHHMGTGVMTRADLDRLMEATDPSVVHLLFDSGHLAFAGDDPVDAARTYASRIKHVHLKDLRTDVVPRVHAENLSFQEAIEEGVFTVPGDGSIDFPSIFEALAGADFDGWLVVEAEQDPAKANPLEYAIKAREYLRETIGF